MNPVVRSKFSGPGAALGMGVFMRNPVVCSKFLRSRFGAWDRDFHEESSCAQQMFESGVGARDGIFSRNPVQAFVAV